MVKVLSRRLVHTHTHTGWEFDDVFGSFQQSSRFEGARRRGEWDGAACPGAFEFVQEPIKVQKKGGKKKTNRNPQQSNPTWSFVAPLLVTAH